mgnify:CR=1 FL=1|tara:strand:- start:5143 stop:5613 length:471 start_codon:yes stop_codon:yes gene_type:complete
MKINNTLKYFIQKLIFFSKWMLIPFLIKLFFTLGILLYHFILYDHITNEQLMVTLEAVDIVMIASLLKMIITGTYHSFVDKNHGEPGENSSSGLLKVKLASSIMGVTSIHLLQTFVNVQQLSWDTINKQLIIHGVFMLGCLVLAIVDYLHCKSDKH